MEKMTNIQAIRRFLGSSAAAGPSPIPTMEELKKLNKMERAELGRLAAEALGVELMEKTGQ